MPPKIEQLLNNQAVEKKSQSQSQFTLRLYTATENCKLRL